MFRPDLSFIRASGARSRRPALTALVGLAVFVSLGTLARADEVYLQSVQTGLYVTQQNDVLAATADLRRALRLDTVRLEHNRVAFRDPTSGRFLRAGIGDKTLLAVASPHIRGWETFERIRLGGDRIALRSVQNGKFVRVNQGRGARLAARSERAGTAESFRLLPARITVPPAGRPDHAAGGPGLAQLVGQYRIIHVAARNGFLVRLGRDLARQAQLRIDRSGDVGATIGCNRLAIRLDVRDGRVRSRGPGMSTKMACPQRSQQVAEADVLSALAAARGVTHQGRTVTFTGRDGRPLLTLRRR